MKRATYALAALLTIVTPIYAWAETNGSVALENPLGNVTVCSLLQKFLNALLAIGIPIAVLFLVYAGFMFIIARGAPKGLAKARTNLVNVLIGIALFLGAWTIGQLVASTINSIRPGTVTSGTGSC